MRVPPPPHPSMSVPSGCASHNLLHMCVYKCLPSHPGMSVILSSTFWRYVCLSCPPKVSVSNPMLVWVCLLSPTFLGVCLFPHPQSWNLSLPTPSTFFHLLDVCHFLPLTQLSVSPRQGWDRHRVSVSLPYLGMSCVLLSLSSFPKVWTIIHTYIHRHSIPGCTGLLSPLYSVCVSVSLSLWDSGCVCLLSHHKHVCLSFFGVCVLGSIAPLQGLLRARKGLLPVVARAPVEKGGVYGVGGGQQRWNKPPPYLPNLLSCTSVNKRLAATLEGNTLVSSCWPFYGPCAATILLLDAVLGHPLGELLSHSA